VCRAVTQTVNRRCGAHGSRANLSPRRGVIRSGVPSETRSTLFRRHTERAERVECICRNVAQGDADGTETNGSATADRQGSISPFVCGVAASTSLVRGRQGETANRRWRHGTQAVPYGGFGDGCICSVTQTATRSCRVARDRVPLGHAAGVNPRPTGMHNTDIHLSEGQISHGRQAIFHIAMRYFTERRSARFHCSFVPPHSTAVKP